MLFGIIGMKNKIKLLPGNSRLNFELLVWYDHTVWIVDPDRESLDHLPFNEIMLFLLLF
jgi:hypothetical protein